MFSGFCPQCGHMFQRDYTALVHWDCRLIYTQNNNNLTSQEFYFVDTFYQDKNFWFMKMRLKRKNKKFWIRPRRFYEAYNRLASLCF